MRNPTLWLYLMAGVVLGGLGAALLVNSDPRAEAATDHFEDYILCTGAVSADYVRSAPFWNAGSKSYHWKVDEVPFDGVWLLDSSTARVLGTVVDRLSGKTVGWAEVDLAKEFAMPPGKNLHFMMSSGAVDHGLTALYLAETTTGKMGIYTLGPRPDGAAGVQVHRHDHLSFRELAH
jgi:hypothetical protein